MHSSSSKRVRMGLVIAGAGAAFVVTSACTGVVGLTGYEFVDGSIEGGSSSGDGGGKTDAPIATGDGATPPDAGTSCTEAFAGFGAACASCAEQMCCIEAVLCGVPGGCAQRARTNSCSSGAGDLSCRVLSKCLKDKCGCGG